MIDPRTGASATGMQALIVLIPPVADGRLEATAAMKARLKFEPGNQDILVLE